VLRESLSPLREREFRLLFLGRLTSFLGSAVAPVALAFAVIDDLDGSASELGLVLTVGWVPQVLFILVGGVLADRLPRHLVLVGANVLSGAAQVFVAVVLITDVGQIWHLALAQFVRGTAQSLFFPASTGLVPQTVPDGLLQQANALLRMTTNASFVVGGAAGGILVATAGAGWALAFDGLTYFASAAILLAMRIPGTVRGATSFVHELREGWTEFRTREWLWVIVLAATFGNMVAQGCWFVLGPIQADRELGGAAGWGVVLAVQAAGLIVGGVIALRLRPRRPLLLAQVAVTISGANLLALALGLPLAGVAAAAFLTGVTLELFGVYWDTALQQHVPRAALSRVSSYDALGSFVAIPIGLSIVGPLSDAIGVEETLWIGAVVFLVAQAGALLSRDVRTLPRREGGPALAAPAGAEPAAALEAHAQRE
jgi:predicted MFS family arabinose efflux permease